MAEKKCETCGSVGPQKHEVQYQGKKIYACSEDCCKCYEKVVAQQV